MRAGSLLCVWLPLLLVVAGILAPSVMAEETALMRFADSGSVVVDGNIAPGEYPGSFLDPATGIQVYMVHDDVNMTVGIVSPGAGWVSIGFGPQGVIMDQANILMGYVAGPTTVLTDQYGVGYAHLPDVQLGGTDDIIEAAGKESGGQTYLEFAFPLSSGDDHDFRLQPGKTYGMILAYASTADDLETKHEAASKNLVAIELNPDRAPTKYASFRLEYEGDLVEGENATLIAEVLDEDGSPMANVSVEFYVNTSVGLGLLGDAVTNESGRVGLNYTFLSPGPHRFVAVFTGTTDYLPATANLTVVVQPAEETVPLLTTGQQIQLVILAVLIGVAVVYAYAAGQIILIRKAGSEVESLPQERNRDT